MRHLFCISRAVDGRGDDAAIRYSDCHRPIDDARIPLRNVGGLAIDVDGRHFAVVMSDAADQPAIRPGLNAPDHRGGRESVHGCQKLGKHDVLDFPGAGLVACPGVDSAIVGLPPTQRKLDADDLQDRARLRRSVEELCDRVVQPVRPRSTSEVHHLAMRGLTRLQGHAAEVPGDSRS